MGRLYDTEHKQKVMEQNAQHTLLFYEKNINIYKHICVRNQYLAEFILVPLRSERSSPLADLMSLPPLPPTIREIGIIL